MKNQIIDSHGSHNQKTHGHRKKYGTGGKAAAKPKKATGKGTAKGQRKSTGSSYDSPSRRADKKRDALGRKNERENQARQDRSRAKAKKRGDTEFIKRDDKVRAEQKRVKELAARNTRENTARARKVATRKAKISKDTKKDIAKAKPKGESLRKERKSQTDVKKSVVKAINETKIKRTAYASKSVTKNVKRLKEMDRKRK